MTSVVKQWGRALLDLEFPLRKVSLVEPSERSCETGPIPRRVVQTWPDDRIGRSHLKSVREFRDTNPGFAFQVFTNADQQDYMNSAYRGEEILKIFNRGKSPVLRADIFRYSFLLDQGGIYIDLSKRLRTPLQQFVTGTSHIILSHERNRVPENCGVHTDPSFEQHEFLFVQWCIMSAPNNRFLHRMLENICRYSVKYEGIRFRSPKQAILELTGPIMWTRSVWEEILANGTRDYEVVDFDFGEPGFPRIPGSYVRFLPLGHYSRARDEIVLLAGNG